MKRCLPNAKHHKSTLEYEVSFAYLALAAALRPGLAADSASDGGKNGPTRTGHEPDLRTLAIRTNGRPSLVVPAEVPAVAIHAPVAGVI
jgi:hypothetical protein